MTPDQFFEPLRGQSLLIPGQAEAYRGQCVQSVGLWVEAQGLAMPAYIYAYFYYYNGIPGYYQIPRGEPIKAGDIVIWGPSFPSSPQAGHIDVASADGTIGDFWGWDSNWNPPLKLNKIHHTGSDNNYILGYLRLINGGEQGMTPELAAAIDDIKQHVLVLEKQVDDVKQHVVVLEQEVADLKKGK